MMTGPTFDPPNTPTGPGADVLDLDAARTHRTGRNPATHFDVPLDDQPTPGGQPVDPPTPPVAPGRRPVIPDSLRGWRVLRATTTHTLGRWAHVVAFHTVRIPWYAAQHLAWAVPGMLVLVRRQLAWWWLQEQYNLRQQAATSNDAAMWYRLHREGKVTRTWRGIVLAAEVIALLAVVPATWRRLAWPVSLLLAAAVVLGLSALARAGGHTIVAPAVVTGRFRKLNTDIVLRAYYAAGLGHPDKANMQVGFGSTMARDASGTGSMVAIDLPHGKTFDDAVRSRGAIASGLDVALSQVFITRDASSHRRHVLFVADRDPLAIPAGRTPLLRLLPTDIWQPAPFGLDERGNLVTVPLLWTSIMIGAQPRQGKTFAARLLALYAALDPHVQLMVFDGGGKPDWRRFALVAQRCAFGLALTRDGDPAELLLAALRELKAEVQDRYERLSLLPPEVCPEGKLTRDIARDPRYRMPVRMLVIDEFQEYFDLGETSKEIAGLLVYLVKVAPAAGIIIIDATQRPSGVGTGQVGQQFISFRDNHQVRFALRTGSWQVSDLVLGAGAYSEGSDSSTLLPTYKGVGILRGAADHTPTVRTYLADQEDAEKILQAARVLREHAGTLTGQAAGEQVNRTARDVLADVRGVFGPGENGLHWQHIAARLAARLPDAYADLTPATISAQLRDLHIPSVNVKIDGEVLKGARLDHIDTAFAKRRTA